MILGNPDDAGRTFSESLLERMVKMEELLRSVKEGLDDHDEKFVSEERLDEKIKGFKDDLLFNEILELQEKNDKLESEILSLQREVCQGRIRTLELLAIHVVHATNHAPPPPHGLLMQRDTCIAQVQIFTSRTMERIERIDTPNEMGDLLMKLLTDVNNTLAYFGFPTIHDIGTSS